MNSLKLLALPFVHKNPDAIICMQTAFRDLVYVAEYQNMKGEIRELQAPAAWTLEQLRKTELSNKAALGTALSDLGPDFAKDLSPENRPKASNFMFQDPWALETSEILQWFQAKALYVRASEAEEKLWKGGSSPSDDRQRDEI
jgi:tRNA A37 threonylcarbamoyladenosine modification protein TsaB